MEIATSPETPEIIGHVERKCSSNYDSSLAVSNTYISESSLTTSALYTWDKTPILPVP